MNQLRHFRRLMDITQEELEGRSGVAQSLISKIERDRVVLTPAMKEARKHIAAALGLDVALLFGEMEDKT
jgi:transcriptional regulator with XRE-family HTH domain